MNANQDIWNVIYAEILKKYPEPVIDLWLKNFELAYFDSELALITTTSEGFVEILNKKYAPEIAELFETTLGFPLTVKIYAKSKFSLAEALEKPTPTVELPAEPIMPEQPKKAEKPSEEEAPADAATSFISEKDYTFDNFIVGSSNKLAHAASVAVANHPTAYNPLFLYGSSGLGKTHLMKAVANEVKRQKPEFNIILIKGEDFTNELVRSIEKKTTAKFKEKYRNADMLLIDDIQFIAGKVSTQEEFFHTFNSLYDAGKQIILTSDRPPKDIQHLEERIQSRFEGGLIVDIQPPDTELRIAILKRKAQLMNVNLSDEVLSFLGENVKSNIRQLEGVIKKLGAYSLVNGSKITIDTARTVLSGVISGTVPPALVAEQIIENISKRYNISIEDIKGKKRTTEIALARHISIYVIRSVTNLSLQNTAKIFGRDHTTILSSIDVIKNKMAEDSSFEYEITNICNEFS
ncbi:MAG: chromosomal replication initiator protein DnaA [Clostridia bacterium]|nr:chromosomal replication initiator protein DnaA [Clostridia bacterium]